MSRLPLPPPSWHVALLVLLGGCERSLRSAVSTPYGLDTLEARHHPPEAVLVVEKHDGSGGGAPCTSGPLCLALVPLILANERAASWQEATLTEGGVMIWHGAYELDGDLIQAELREGDRWRALAVLDLDLVRRRLVVEVASAPLAADGGHGDWAPTALLPQTDLAVAYPQAFSRARTNEDREELVQEAWGWLGAEAVDLIVAWAKEQTDDRLIASALISVCAAGRPPADPYGHLTGNREDLVLALAPVAGPKTLDHGLSCLDHPEPGETVLGTRLAEMVCNGQLSSELGFRNFRSAVRTHPGVRAAAEAAERNCKPLRGRAALQVALGGALSPKELRLALAEESSSTPVWAVVDLRNAEDRAAVYTALAVSEQPTGLLTALLQGGLAPTQAEFETLVDLYLRQAGRDLGVRARLLALFDRKRPGPETGKAVERLSAAQAPGEDEASMAMALGVLGDHSKAWRAVRLAPPRRLVESPATVGTVADLVGFGLGLMGCDQAQVLAAAETVRLGGGEGAVCR